jgi:predicted P-loop ATPase
MQRGYVWCGCGNKDAVYEDPTGGRRYVVLELSGSDERPKDRYDLKALTALLPQLWAEAAAMVRSAGIDAYREVLAAVSTEVRQAQRESRAVSEVEDRLAEALSNPDAADAITLGVSPGQARTAPVSNQMLDQILKIERIRSRHESQLIGAAMTALGWRSKSVRDAGVVGRRWVLDETRTSR